MINGYHICFITFVQVLSERPHNNNSERILSINHKSGHETVPIPQFHIVLPMQYCGLVHEIYLIELIPPADRGGASSPALFFSSINLPMGILPIDVSAPVPRFPLLGASRGTNRW
jgi:hypothetical protein